MVIFTARAKAKKDCVAKFHSELLTVAEFTRKETGCISYQVFQDVNDPTIIMVHELWKSNSDVELHMQQPYVQKLFSLVPELCDGAPELRSWTKL